MRLMLHTDAGSASHTGQMGKLGALASFLLAGTFVIAPAIYLTGNLHDPRGVFEYALADFLYGPVWGSSLIVAVSALRERIGEGASRRSSLALLVSVLAAGAMVLVACVRAANRHYHLIHPELDLENSIPVLIVWTTIVAGVTGAGWHFLGWALVLLGSGAWTSRRLPRSLAVAYFIGGIASLFVYVWPNLEGMAGIFGVIWSIWQGVLLSRDPPAKTQPGG